MVSRLPNLTSAYLRSEEHTSELQSQFHLVCRLLLEKKNKPRSDRAATSDPDRGGLRPPAADGAPVSDACASNRSNVDLHTLSDPTRLAGDCLSSASKSIRGTSPDFSQVVGASGL